MIERDIYCDDILNQIAAAQSALSALSRVLLERHLKSCVVSRIQTEDTAVLDELLTTFGKLMR
jgi:CsoR family transcriptional regulator, copper-sensing transcriptional repressor